MQEDMGLALKEGNFMASAKTERLLNTGDFTNKNTVRR